MKDITQLLKKSKGKLTGDEVGRLMIADLVEAYKHALTGGDVNKGILSDKEKSELVKGLEGSHNITRYNKYRYLNDFLTRFPTLNALQEQIFDNYYFRLYSLLKNAENAEQEYWFDHFTPLIVTEEKYKELTAEQNAHDREATYSAIDIFMEYLLDLISKYENGKRVKIRKEIDKTKSQPITNKRIKTNYYEKGENGHYETKEGETENQVNPVVWQELISAHELVFIDEREAPDDITAYEILQDALGYYSPEEILTEFKADYPAIFSYIWDEMIKEPVLEPITEMTPEELINTSFITGLELANAGILDFKQRIKEGYRASDISYCGVAVLKCGLYNTETATLGRMPHYHFLSEHLLEGGTKEVIENYIAALQNCLIELYSYNTALEIIRDVLGIDGLEIFYSNMERRKDQIEILNDMFAGFYELNRDGRTPDEMLTEELRTELKELLKPISINDYKPSEEIIEQLKANFSLDALEGKGLAYTDEIAQAIRSSLEEG
jgi:hypothetical protein